MGLISRICRGVALTRGTCLGMTSDERKEVWREMGNGTRVGLWEHYRGPTFSFFFYSFLLLRNKRMYSHISCSLKFVVMIEIERLCHTNCADADDQITPQ